MNVYKFSPGDIVEFPYQGKNISGTVECNYINKMLVKLSDEYTGQFNSVTISPIIAKPKS